MYKRQGYSFAGEPVRARDLKAQGAMAALLQDELKPNLVHTLEGTPAFEMCIRDRRAIAPLACRH